MKVHCKERINSTGTYRNRKLKRTISEYNLSACNTTYNRLGVSLTSKHLCAGDENKGSCLGDTGIWSFYKIISLKYVKRNILIWRWTVDDTREVKRFKFVCLHGRDRVEQASVLWRCGLSGYFYGKEIIFYFPKLKVVLFTKLKIFIFRESISILIGF